MYENREMDTGVEGHAFYEKGRRSVRLSELRLIRPSEGLRRSLSVSERTNIVFVSPK